MEQFFDRFMEQWPSGEGAEFLIQGSYVQITGWFQS